MMRRLAMVVAMLWVLTGIGVAANSDESPAFLLNTLTPAGTGTAVSPAFVVNTLTPGGTSVAVSGGFTVDTRKPEGQSGSRVSGGLVVDTRNAGLTHLTVNGASTVLGGEATQFQCIAHYSDGRMEDATTQATWTVTGGPPGTQISTGRLVAGRGPAATATVTASMIKLNGQRTSLAFPVSIARALRVTLRQPVVTLNSRNGQSFQWQVLTNASVFGGQGTMSAVWRWNGVPITGQNTLTLFTPLTSGTGSGLLSVAVTDSNGGAGGAVVTLTFDKPPVGAEGAPRFTSGDVEEGPWLDAEGNAVNLSGPEWTARKANGLVVLTHGLVLGGGAEGQRTWLKEMAGEIKTRVEAAAGSSKVPNILIYDWTHDATASQDYDDEKLDELVADTIRKVGPEVAGQTPAEIIDWLYKRLQQRGQVNRNIVGALFGFQAATADFRETLRHDFGDIILIRGRGQTHGQFLARRIREKIAIGDIVATAPIHFIGHSAGGFVVGECAKDLRQPHVAHPGPVLITMLDTPAPFTSHLPPSGSQMRLERYVSSYFGGGVLTPQWDLDLRVVSNSGFAGSTAATVVTVPKIKPDQKYHLFDIPNRPSLLNPVVNHAYGHEWYLGTIQDSQNSNGFSHSPFGGNHPWSNAPAIPLPPAAFALGGVQANALLGGFQTYGNVAAAAGSYVLTEEDNAGIFRVVALSVDTEKLRFRYRFTTPGDGDFLAVSVNFGLPLLIGADTEISRTGMVTAEVDLMQFAGETVRLDIKLVSRGQPGAVVTLDEIEILTNDDQDGDGLTNAFELSIGTSAFLFDSDGDGLDDNYESSVSHTNAVLADSDGDGVSDFTEILAGTNSGSGNSVFAIKSIAPAAGGGVALSWTGRSGSKYLVLRSTTPDFASFDVIAAAVPGVAPLTTFTDTMIAAPQTAGAFYRVEVADAPAYQANMNADSDGDGIPDGWELDRGFNADLATDALLDADGDGNSTLLEFALGTDPRVNSPDGIGIYMDEDGYLTLTTNRNPAASGLQFRIAVSGNLAAWHSDAAHVTILANTPTLLKARDTTPPGAAARRFIRLEVSR